jgi:protease I
MQKPLTNLKVAILLANGFNENEMTNFQRVILEAGGNPRIVSIENGLANGWQGTAWGHYFAVDCALPDALAADFDVLVVPGGQRSLDKLKLTAHTRRFMGGFLAAQKPIALIGDSIQLLVHNNQMNGVMVTGPDVLKEAVVSAGGLWSENSPTISHNIMTWNNVAENVKEMAEAFIQFVTEQKTAREQEMIRAA